MNHKKCRTFLRKVTVVVACGLFIILLTICSNSGKANASGSTLLTVTSTPTAVVSSTASSSNDTLQIINTVIAGVSVLLTFVYVIITFGIFRKTIESLELTRQQININKQESQVALAASEQQSKATVDAVHEQIAISEKQSREALYNQHKPVVLPLHHHVSNNSQMYTMSIVNRGTGVALNSWGILTMRGFPQVHSFIQTYFLIPNVEIQVSLRHENVQYYTNVYEGYSIYPQDNESDITTSARFMLTYTDAFDNKYLAIFDYSDEFSWRQVEMKRVEKRLDELAVKAKAN